MTVEIAAMRHAPRLEVQSFIEIAKQKYAHHPDPLRMEALMRGAAATVQSPLVS